MAKTTPIGSMPEKVTLRPTAIGVHVIERLNRPGTEKSALLRHLVELGYACEQAGFILDGTVLRHGGAVWEIQPQIGTAPPPGRIVSAAATPALPSQAHEPAVPLEPNAAGSHLVGAKAEVGDPAKSATASNGGLAARLRKLSG